MLKNPKYSSVKELTLLIISAEHGANYNYLLNMSYRDLTEEAYNKRDAQINQLQNRQISNR